MTPTQAQKVATFFDAAYPTQANEIAFAFRTNPELMHVDAFYTAMYPSQNPLTTFDMAEQYCGINPGDPPGDMGCPVATIAYAAAQLGFVAVCDEASWGACAAATLGVVGTAIAAISTCFGGSDQ